MIDLIDYIEHVISEELEMIIESPYRRKIKREYPIFYHGSPTGEMKGLNGIHVGTLLAATQALESRVGVPASGVWDGTREYGETLLAGRKSLQRIENERGLRSGELRTGYNSGRHIPEDDYLPHERNDDHAVFGDGSRVPMNSRPNIFPVRIIGRMTNSPGWWHEDSVANGMMNRFLKSGNARSGYFYKNIAEDVGSISAVVPDESFLERV